jgi:hypothetical protein
MPVDLQYFNEIPTKVEITLYRYNYIDGLIITCLRNEADFRNTKKYESKFEVQTDELKKIFVKNAKLKREFAKFKEMGNASPQEVNTVYFLNAMFTNYPMLDTFVISLNTDKNYSRLVESEDRKIISFEHRVLQGKIDICKGRSIDEIRLFNEVMLKLGIFENSRKNFVEIKAADLVNELVKYEEETEEDAIDGKFAPVFNAFFSWIEEKLEEDNTSLIIVTDFV